MNKIKTWTDSELAVLAKLTREGKTATVIATNLGRTVSEVKAKQNSTSLPVNDKDISKFLSSAKEAVIKSEWYDKGNNDIYSIANIANLPPIVVSETLRRIRIEMPQQEIDSKVVNITGMNPDETKQHALEFLRANGAKPAELKQYEPLFWDNKQPEGDIDSLIDSFEDMRKKIKGLEKEQRSVTVQLNTESPWVMLAIVGDLHIGSQEVNVKEIREDFELIANEPNAYLGFSGDATDNWTTALSYGVHEQLLSPSAARKIFKHLVGIASKKMLFMVHGCHDNFSITNDDYNLVEEVANENKIPYLGYGGKISILCNTDVVYNVTCWHKRSGSSTNNMFQPCISTLKNFDMDNDVVAVAHNHVSGISMQSVQERERIFVRTSSYKNPDRFAKKIGYADITDDVKPRIIPCVLFNTKTKEMRPAHHISEGVELLRFLNNQAEGSCSLPKKKK